MPSIKLYLHHVESSSQLTFTLFRLWLLVSHHIMYNLFNIFLFKIDSFTPTPYFFSLHLCKPIIHTCIVWSANLCSVVGYSPILSYTCSTLCLYIFLIIWSFLIQYSITILFILLFHIFPQFWIRRLMTTWYSKPTEHDTCQMRHFNHLLFQSR